ncbi:stomatin family protein [Flagelloscypha sp. PMI_526]|nr:stomatin family protein [Flagelloscypha sp. PMI_526]
MQRLTRPALATLRQTPRQANTVSSTLRLNAVRSFFTIVHQGHEGWRLAFGRDPVRLDPGLRLKIPLYHTVQEVDIREKSVNISALEGFTSDNVPVLVSGSLFFKVGDSYDACFKVDDYERSVAAIGTSATRSIIGSFAYDEIIGDRNNVNARLHEIIGKSISQWGVECTRFEIQTFKPANQGVERQLELQMQAERERRKQILDTQALVNVAEGHKQKTILASEGELQASENVAKALANQVRLVANALGDDTDNSSPEIREKALSALLELKKLEQLRAIAEGQGNATYFFGDATRTSGRDAYDVENMEKWKRTMGTKPDARVAKADVV